MEEFLIISSPKINRASGKHLKSTRHITYRFRTPSQKKNSNSVFRDAKNGSVEVKHVGQDVCNR